MRTYAQVKGLFKMTVTSDINSSILKWTRDVANFTSAHENFLSHNYLQINRQTKTIVKRVVYEVPFKPKVYIRTGNLLKSINFSVLSQSLTRSEGIIGVDPGIAPAIIGGGSYAQYVAGEGVGGLKIGFLKTSYGKRNSYFPRRFHEALQSEVAGNLFDTYEQNVLKFL